MVNYDTSDIQRFWSYVTKTDGCWECSLGKTQRYPVLVLHSLNVRTSIKAHRFSWMLANGEIPDGLHVLHTCDNTRCVRPDHLFLGTQLDNNADRHLKGRTAIKHLSDYQVLCNTPEAVKKRKATFAIIGHMQGEKNSAFGTCWIKNMEIKKSMRVKKEDLEIYLSAGWLKGAKHKW